MTGWSYSVLTTTTRTTTIGLLATMTIVASMLHGASALTRPLVLTQRPSFLKTLSHHHRVSRTSLFATAAETLVGTPATSFDDGKRPFEITTPIYYVNDKPHIGHAYTSTGTSTCRLVMIIVTTSNTRDSCHWSTVYRCIKYLCFNFCLEPSSPVFSRLCCSSSL